MSLLLLAAKRCAAEQPMAARAQLHSQGPAVRLVTQQDSPVCVSRWPGGITDALQDEDADAEASGSRDGSQAGRQPRTNGAQHHMQGVPALQQSHLPDAASDERHSSAVR